MKNLLLLAFAALFVCSCGKMVQADTVAIIPQPVHLEMEKGTFVLSDATKVTYPAGNEFLERAAKAIAERLGEVVGSPLKVETEGKEADNTIVLKVADDSLKAEGYKMEIEDNEIEIEAVDYNGAFYALQSLLQLMPTEVYAGGKVASKVAIPQLKITDYPRFEWRGMHLDVSRHFFDAQSVKKYIDFLAMHKLNRFHWHLTDDQGWRMESKKYPLLTEKSAWRVDRNSQPWDDRKPLDSAAGEKATYGGFYTQDEIRDIVAYAAKRGIAVVPEIEMPGHSSEVFAAYGNLSCLGVQQQVTPGGYYPTDMATCFCAGNEESFTFLEGIIDEVIELFPDAPYIHIGGDEVDKRFWSSCPKCQARMRAEGLKSVDELQSYFIKRMEKYINGKGKRIIGWDEILEGGVAPDATVMSWRGIAGGIEAARSGHDVIMTPNSHLYFDYYQNDPSVEPIAIGGYIPTSKVYSFEPIPEALTPEQANHIKGAQANMWVEFITSFKGVERMVLPRMAALSEVVWSPKEARNWADFNQRLATEQQRYKALGAAAHPGCTDVNFISVYDPATKSFTTEMVSEIYGTDIYFTTDGSTPTLQSTKYTEPVAVDKTTLFKAIVANGSEVISQKASERTIGMHKGIGKTITYTKAPSEAYTASGATTLVDGLTSGSTNHNDGKWQGFNSADFDLTIDLGTNMSFEKVVGSFLQSTGTWIYLPLAMDVWVGDSPSTLKLAGTATQDFDPFKNPTLIHQFVVDGQMKGRYVRVVGKNGITKEGLPGAGTRNWIFADEIFIN